MHSKTLRISALMACFILLGSFAFSATPAQEVQEKDEAFNAVDMVMHHITDAHVWHLWDGHYGTIPLPVILYSSDKGLDVFMSSNFYDDHHNIISYKGYKLEHEHISIAGSDAHVFDFSITKNVAALIVNSILVLLIFLAVAKKYKLNTGKAPSGIQSFFEPIIVFVRDEIVKPNIGKGYERFMPYMLTLFFFIWISNLIGLMPGSANLTGNIAVTMVLAVGTFLITNLNGNRNYWKHIFWTPGVPTILKVIIVPVEMIGAITKPISLMIRLFVAISAGHIVILSLLGLTFIFQSWLVGFGSSIVVLFINLIELLVATIQAYVFTMFSSLYIGMATATEEHH